jgi:hypothetical protein
MIQCEGEESVNLVMHIQYARICKCSYLMCICTSTRAYDGICFYTFILILIINIYSYFNHYRIQRCRFHKTNLFDK